jgi:hypothetical protein
VLAVFRRFFLGGSGLRCCCFVFEPMTRHERGVVVLVLLERLEFRIKRWRWSSACDMTNEVLCGRQDRSTQPRVRSPHERS